MWVLKFWIIILSGNFKKVPLGNNTQTSFYPTKTLIEKYSFDKYYNSLKSIENIFVLKWIYFVISFFWGFNNCNWALISFNLQENMCYKITSNLSWPQIAFNFSKILWKRLSLISLCYTFIVYGVTFICNVNFYISFVFIILVLDVVAFLWLP